MIKLLLILQVVTATTYTLAPRENGPYGNQLASGFRANPKTDRIIAVSRDLLKSYPFHSKVVVTNAGNFNGVWIVEDIMNKRYRKRIDFLIADKSEQNKFYKVKLSHYERKKHIRHRNHRSNTLYHVRAKQHHQQVKRHHKKLQRRSIHRQR